jgi:hypothetical protein
MATATEPHPPLPVWRLVLPRDEHGTSTKSSAPVLLIGNGGVSGRQLKKRIDVPAGGKLLVTFDRGFARGLADLFARGRLQRRTTASRRRMIRTLRESGLVVEAEYDVWPSAEAPRLVLRRGDLSAIRWVRRSGVLGGGGRTLWKRALARSPLMTVIAWLFPLAGAVLARRPE